MESSNDSVSEEIENVELDRPQPRGSPENYVTPNNMVKEKLFDYVEEMNADSTKPKSFDM